MGSLYLLRVLYFNYRIAATSYNLDFFQIYNCKYSYEGNNNNNNNTHNLAKTITDKQNKHQEMANEICVMWKQKAAQVMPIVISSTGVIPKSLSQSLTRLNLHPNTYIQLQKSVIVGTCSIVRNFLNYK